MRENYDPTSPRANQQAFAVDTQPHYEYRAAVALMFALMYCLPIVAGVIAILTARNVLRAPVAISNTAKWSSIVSIVLGCGNIIMWMINLAIRVKYWYVGAGGQSV